MIDFSALGSEQLQAMAEAGREVLECHRVLAKTGDNIVSEVLPREGTFYEYDHCPPGDIYDPETHSQYYYHSHRSGEHGHFHTFMREKGMPEGIHPVDQSDAEYLKGRDDKLSHLVAISMARLGVPIGLFTTNRWVTAENWYAAEDVCALVDRFRIEHAQPSWPTNRWVTAMFRLFRPQIVELLHKRDAVVADWQEQNPDEAVFEDRRLDLPSRGRDFGGRPNLRRPSRAGRPRLTGCFRSSTWPRLTAHRSLKAPPPSGCYNRGTKLTAVSASEAVMPGRAGSTACTASSDPLHLGAPGRKPYDEICRYGRLWSRAPPECGSLGRPWDLLRDATPFES